MSRYGACSALVMVDLQDEFADPAGGLGVRLGFRAGLIGEAVAAVNLADDDGNRALDEKLRYGVTVQRTLHIDAATVA